MLLPRAPGLVSSKLTLEYFSIRENQEEAGNSMHLGLYALKIP